MISNSSIQCYLVKDISYSTVQGLLEIGNLKQDELICNIFYFWSQYKMLLNLYYFINYQIVSSSNKAAFTLFKDNFLFHINQLLVLSCINYYMFNATYFISCYLTISLIYLFSITCSNLYWLWSDWQDVLLLIPSVKYVGCISAEISQYLWLCAMSAIILRSMMILWLPIQEYYISALLLYIVWLLCYVLIYFF